tara:strand:+ start:1958 stop:2278 length:321 start_codon:yes stop_codon:yes gene_type:complete
MRRVDFEVDGLSVDALVVSCYPRRLGFDFASDLGEVVELPPWDVEEFSPFLLASDTCWRVWDVHFVALVLISLAGKVDELQNKWPPGNDATTSGEEVSADDVLEYR